MEKLYSLTGTIDTSHLDDNAEDDLIDGIREIARRDACNSVFDFFCQLRGRSIFIDGFLSEDACEDLDFLLWDFHATLK